MPANISKDPKKVLVDYYESLYSGKLDKVKDLMTWDSYTMTLESFGLRLALKDKNFKSLLKELEKPEALQRVESYLSDELVSRKKHPIIKIKSAKLNGLTRQTIYYSEDGRDKVLHFSKAKDGWKIDYLAGRKVV